MHSATKPLLRSRSPGEGAHPDAGSEQDRVDWGAIATWVLSFALVAYLGWKGGGFDPLVHDQIGIAIWWIVLAGVAVGALPRRRPGPPAAVALGLLAAFAVWTALSLIWTESAERTSADIALVGTYLGIFALALLTRARGDTQRVVAAVGAAIVLVSTVALLSRLHPSWFPDATETGRILEDTERLSYPLNYWNGLAGLIAIGLPLLLQLANGARTVLVRAVAAAALPALVLTAFLTLSRGGIAAAIIALAVYLALSADRLPRFLTVLVAGVGGAILIAAVDGRDALQQGLLNTTAGQQGDEMLAITAAVCFAVGFLQAGIALVTSQERRPAWTRMPRRAALTAGVGALLVALVVALAIDLPGRASGGWSEFKEGGGPGKGTGRLGSVAGQSRYQFWSSAVRENASAPFTGSGSGTFEFWWNRDGDTAETVHDAHSLYMQTLGELGIVGLALLAAFLLTILVSGARKAIRTETAQRAALAAALAGCTAFCLTAAVDWMWQLPVLPAALLILGSTLVSDPGDRPQGRSRAFPALARIALAAIALAAIVAIAIPLASTSLLRESEADARSGDLEGALAAAQSAQNVEPGAASPRLQQALVLEEQGNLRLAEEAARAATERESTNWRTWLVLSRIEAKRGHTTAAVRHFRRARSLNPRSSLFAG